MATINLLPEAEKHKKVLKEEGVKIPLKIPKPFLLVLPPFILLFFIILAGLAFQVKSKKNSIAALDKKLSNLKASYQEIETLNKRKKELSDRLAFYQGLFENNILWSEKLSLINNVLPSQVWLTSIYTETKPNRILVIKGSATSSVESEIIDSISEFVDQLKKEPSFTKDIGEIKMGSLISEKKGNLSVMNFSLLCRLKQ